MITISNNLNALEETEDWDWENTNRLVNNSKNWIVNWTISADGWVVKWTCTTSIAEYNSPTFGNWDWELRIGKIGTWEIR